MKKFDLEAAKAGAPIITRDGSEARFIGHVPEAPVYSVVAFVAGGTSVTTFTSAGRCYNWDDSKFDLFMKPQKRTVWVNLNKESGKFYIHETEESAKRGAECIAGGVSSHLLAACVPIEIEE